KVRFFGGWSYADDLCGSSDRVDIGYSEGEPMGSDLRSRPDGAAAPRFLVSAIKDEGVLDPDTNQLVPGTGTPLQRIQVVKGWVDTHGKTHEKVFDVVGGPPSEAVDPSTCSATQPGSGELCTVWTDPDFDPAAPAFYYARLLEDPTCRWSTYACQSLGVDPFADDCPVKALTARPGSNLLDCCPERISPAVQERAWTSPIWYTPSS
ncbi:MAG: DUF3604 domain-containing protein, partial [Candidatus Binatia bacterium]